MTTSIEQGSPGRTVVVGEVTDGYEVQRILSVRTGRHTLAEASSPDGERVLLQLCEEQPAEKGLRRRAARLASARRQIAHGHLLPLVGNGSAGGDLYWGGLPGHAITLAEKVGSTALEPAWVVTILSQVAGALETAGRRGLLPRNLTPADILVTDEDPPRALLADLGTDVPDVPSCKYRSSVADADYLSPEETRGEPPTSESSVYSLACILVHCLTGAPPFPFDRPLLAIYAHRVEEPPRMSEREPRLPAELDQVISRALSKDPRRRQRTPAALMGAVQDALRLRAPIPVRTRASARPATVRPAPAAPAAPPAPAARPAPPARRPHSEPAPAPAAASAPATHGGPKPRRPRRERPKRREHQRRERTFGIPRAAITWSSVALVASALAGFAAGTGGTEQALAPPASRPAAPPASEASGPTVSPVLSQLQSRRVTLRRQLRQARSPEEQLRAVKGLERAYGGAHAALQREAGPVPGKKSLLASLGEVENAYRDLAAAASRPSPRAWQDAREQVSERERDLELLLRTHRWA